MIEAPRLPDHVQTSIDNLPETLPATIERINQVERVAPGMRPIWRSFAFLWDALRQALPGGKAEEPPTRNRTSSVVAGAAATRVVTRGRAYFSAMQ